MDGAAASATYGPFGPSASGAYFYSGLFGPLAAGSHNYVIQVTDANGLTASRSGTFVVAAAAPPVIFGVVVAEASAQNGVLDIQRARRGHLGGDGSQPHHQPSR